MTGLDNDPFTLLGLPARLDLASDAIERAYLTRVASAHPDVQSEATTGDAATLNRARHTLLDPERRANALLDVLGGPSPSDHNALPDGFLFDIMETREQVEADTASDADAARAKWGAWAESQRAAYLADLTERFAAPEPDRSAIRAQLNAWRYIERLIEQLDPDYDPARADFDGPACDR
ncbi:MAG: iron-sulfur cluster co-chaperone HscB C-terminal domain-containing protein [Planctomycetota bacterium]